MTWQIRRYNVPVLEALVCSLIRPWTFEHEMFETVRNTLWLFYNQAFKQSGWTLQKATSCYALLNVGTVTKSKHSRSGEMSLLGKNAFFLHNMLNLKMNYLRQCTMNIFQINTEEVAAYLLETKEYNILFRLHTSSTTLVATFQSWGLKFMWPCDAKTLFRK